MPAPSAAGPRGRMAISAAVLAAASAVAYYWALSGSTTFLSMFSRWREPVAPGAAPSAWYLYSLPRHALPGVWYFWASGSLGQLLIAPFWPQTESAASRTLVGVLAGFAALTYGLWFLGLAGLYSTPGLWTFCALATIAALFGSPSFLRSLSSCARDILNGFRAAQGGRNGWGPAALSLSVLLLGMQLIATHAPSLSGDDLSYHLYLPATYLSLGGVNAPPYPQQQSFYHQMISMSYVPALAFGGDAAAMMMNFFWSLLLVLAGSLLAGQAAGEGGAASWAALCVLALPTRFYVAQTATTDLAAACYALGGLWCLLAWRQRQTIGLLALSAFLSGFSLNKYTSISTFAATVLVLLWLTRRRPREAIRGLILFGGLAVLCLAPLALYLWTTQGNPFYPLPFLGLPWDKIEAAEIQGCLETRHDWRMLRGMLMGSLGYFGPWPAMAAAMVPLARAMPAGAMLLAWTAATVVLKYFTYGAAGFQPRYITASLIAAACAAVAVLSFLERERGAGKPVRAFLLASCLVPCAFVTATVSRPQWALNFGRIGESEFLLRLTPARHRYMADFINALPAGSKVAVVAHHFHPHLYRDSGAHLLRLSYDDYQLFEPGAVKALLARRGATHVLWMGSEWDLHAAPRGVVMSGALYSRRLLCRWWEQDEALPFLRPVYEAGREILFEVTR